MQQRRHTTSTTAKRSSEIEIYNLMYVPVYAVFWALLAFSSQADRRVLPLRAGLIVCTVAVFSIIGFPCYLSATAAMSARDNNIPAFLRAGWALLTFDYWRGLISRFSTCDGEQPVSHRDSAAEGRGRDASPL